MFLPIRQLIKEKESLYVFFSMENYYYTLNEYVCLYLTVFIFFASTTEIHSSYNFNQILFNIF